MSKYQGKTVTSRPAREGDQGYDATKDQVVVKTDDGKEKTVPRDEVTE